MPTALPGSFEPLPPALLGKGQQKQKKEKNLKGGFVSKYLYLLWLCSTWNVLAGWTARPQEVFWARIEDRTFAGFVVRKTEPNQQPIHCKERFS